MKLINFSNPQLGSVSYLVLVSMADRLFQNGHLHKN